MIGAPCTSWCAHLHLFPSRRRGLRRVLRRVVSCLRRRVGGGGGAVPLRLLQTPHSTLTVRATNAQPPLRDTHTTSRAHSRRVFSPCTGCMCRVVLSLQSGCGSGMAALRATPRRTPATARSARTGTRTGLETSTNISRKSMEEYDHTRRIRNTIHLHSSSFLLPPLVGMISRRLGSARCGRPLDCWLDPPAAAQSVLHAAPPPHSRSATGQTDKERSGE